MWGEEGICVWNEGDVAFKSANERWTGNTCLVACRGMFSQQKTQFIVWIHIFWLATVKITCWTDFSNPMFTRQRQLQLPSLLGHRTARSLFSNLIFIKVAVSWLHTERQKEGNPTRSLLWCNPVTPTGIPLGSQPYRFKGWKADKCAFYT